MIKTSLDKPSFLTFLLGIFFLVNWGSCSFTNCYMLPVGFLSPIFAVAFGYLLQHGVGVDRVSFLLACFVPCLSVIDLSIPVRVTSWPRGVVFQ